MWGFTVDDAWIPVRYARHIASGDGYVWNVGSPASDGVTPLPWPWVLAVFGRATAASVWQVARWAGVVAWLGAAWALGEAMGRSKRPSWARAVACLALAVLLPIAAYSGSGMETGVATALATLAAVAPTATSLAVLAGASASLRPELLPWALVLTAADSLRRPGLPRIHARALLFAFTPFAACSIFRWIAFGRPAPLALLAKPSDLSHGLLYAGACLVGTVGPLLAFAPITLARCSRRGFAILLAAAAHTLTIVVVGGDWMPYGRLFAPIGPSLVYAFVLSVPMSGRQRPWRLSAVRAVFAIALGAYMVVQSSKAGRLVVADREALIREARPWLEGVRSAAALDIGWVSAATDARIVDLAGLTDPDIAALPGGHTSKRVDASLLLEKDPEVLLLFVTQDGIGRVVEQRLAESPLVQTHFAPSAFLHLGAKGDGYLVLRRR